MLTCMRMRTTVELSDPLYQRLRREAADRGLRGYSPIVEAALAEYLAPGRHGQAVVAARGAWKEAEAEELERAIAAAWSGWPTDPS